MSYYIIGVYGNDSRFACSVNQGENFFLSVERRNVYEFPTKQSAEYVVDILGRANPDWTFSVLELD